jgi:hypothetical protein
VHLNAALAEVARRGNLDQFPASEEEKLTLMLAVKRLGLVSWRPDRSHYELTDLGRQRLVTERATTAPPAPRHNPSIGRGSRLLIGGAAGLLAGAACMMFIPALFTSAPQRGAITAPAPVQHAKAAPAPAPSRESAPPQQQSTGERTAAAVIHDPRYQPERQVAPGPGSTAPTLPVQPDPAAPKPSAPVSLTHPAPANSESELAGGTADSPASTQSASEPRSSSTLEGAQEPSSEVPTRPVRHAATAPKHASADSRDARAEAVRKDRKRSKFARVGHASTRHFTTTETARRHTEDTRENRSSETTRSGRRDAEEGSPDAWSSGKTRIVDRVGPLVREERELSDGTLVRRYRYGNGPAYYVTRRNGHFSSGPRPFTRIGPPGFARIGPPAFARIGPPAFARIGPWLR